MDCCTTDYPRRGHEGGHGHGHGHGHSQGRGGCCCCCCRPSCCCDGEDYGRGLLRRHFISPREELEMLTEYLQELKNEMAGVEAEIKRLKAGK